MLRFGKVEVRRFAQPGMLAWYGCAGFILVGESSTALASVELSPYASVAYAYQSNPLYTWGGSAVHLSPASDSVLRAEGGADARFVWSRQALAASAVIRQFDYAKLDYLERTEDLLAANYDWTPTSAVGAGASYRHEHRMVPFDELAVVREALMETENAAAASLNVGMPQSLQLMSRFGVRDLDSPRPGVPDLNLHETSLRETLRRPVGKLSVGLDGEYLNGSYHGAGNFLARDYDQLTLHLIADRVISGFSTFSTALGYTKRDESGASGISTVTGFVRYERTFTGKTAGEVFLRRDVNTYISGASAELNTAFGVRASWQPTTKLLAEVSLVRTLTDYPGNGGSRSRQDHYQYTDIQLHYQATEYLSLVPYGRYAARSSNQPLYGFNATEVGIELVFREPR